jgi:hypothetical protein
VIYCHTAAANAMLKEAFHHDYSKQAKILEIVDTTVITITFILASVMAHHGL